LVEAAGEWALVCLTHNILKMHRMCYVIGHQKT